MFSTDWGRRTPTASRLKDHVLIGNTFRRLVKQRNYYFWTIAMASGSTENYGDNGDAAGYGRPKNILITQNRFEHCDSRIAAGTYLRQDYPLLPEKIRAVQNAFIGTKATTPSISSPMIQAANRRKICTSLETPSNRDFRLHFAHRFPDLLKSPVS